MLNLTLYITGAVTFEELFSAMDRAKDEASRMWSASGETQQGFESFDFDLRAAGTKVDLSIRLKDEE